MRLTAVVALFPDLPEPELATWVARGWVRPARSVPYAGSSKDGSPQTAGPSNDGSPSGSSPDGFPGDGSPGEGSLGDGSLGGSQASAADEWIFQEIDIARVRLIRDLRHAMSVQEETIPLVLSLLDQVYALRGQMHAMARAVEAQDTAVRNAILDALRDA